MTVDEALDRLERYEQIGLGSDVTALKTLRRYVERVREVELDAHMEARYGAGVPMKGIANKLAAAREGRDE